MLCHRTTPSVLMWIFLMIGALPALAEVDAVPFEAVVTANPAEVRAGAGETFYLVGQLERGSRVSVEEVIFGWSKIVAPPNTYSYVAKDAIVASPDGTIGTVQADRTAARAASLGGPVDSFRRQIYLLKDDQVQIVEQVDQFYKILPPQGAFVFLPPDTLRRLTSKEIDASLTFGSDTNPDTPDRQDSADMLPPAAPTPSAAVEPDPTPQGPILIGWEKPAQAQPDQDLADMATPAASQDSPTAVAAEVSSKPEVDPAPQVVQAELERAMAREALLSAHVVAAEKRMQIALEQPLEDQPIDELLSVYERLWQQPDLSLNDRRTVAARLQYLRRNAAVIQALQRISTAKRHGAAQVHTAGASSSTVDTRPVRYSVMGQLVASGVYDGRKLPRLYRILDTGSHRTVAYVRPGPALHPGSKLGRYVGVVGSSQYDPALRLDVIDATRIDVLAAYPSP